jgi:hypothetical protein
MFHSYSSDSITRSSANSANSKARSNSTDIEFLKSEIERLLMITESLWGYIKKEHDYEDKDLFKKVLEIDARDGRVDGKVAASAPKKCPECNYTLPRRKPFCLYCGTRIAKDCFER